MLQLLIPVVSATAGPSNGMILRIRLIDGTVRKIQIPPGVENEMTLAEALSPLEPIYDSIQVGSSIISNPTQILSALNLKHGTLISLTKNTADATTSQSKSPTSTKRSFDPYPELAKDYSGAMRNKSRRRGSMSYGDLANLASALHVVEPQNKGPIERVYMCQPSAERFHASKKKVGLLLGTIAKERLDQKTTKLKTSISTSTIEYCQAAKVHAIWEPSTGEGILLEQTHRVRQLASWLDIVPLGWIFVHSNEDALLGPEIVMGAQLQISQMQTSDGTDNWITCSMDQTTGATEAFQLSNLAVQMVAEDMFVPGGGRYVTTSHPIIVDGKETTKLDTVLCLINTAMLAHVGKFAGVASVKKNGMLMAKAKQALLVALEKNDSILNCLCDFNLLMALDPHLPSEQMETLCGLVKKWARGQKQGTTITPQLKTLLKGILSQ